MTYIIIGIVFMFCLDFLSTRKSIKIHLAKEFQIGWKERVIGILLWPICLGIFIYNFLINLLNK